MIRPLVLFADRTATHPDTVRTLRRRFHQQGMLGPMPASLEMTPRGRAARVPDAVRREIDRLKALYAGFHYRELARIFFTFVCPLHHNTVKQLWHQNSISTPQPPTRGAYRTHVDRAHARLQIVRLYYQGWDYDWRKRHVTNIRGGVFYLTRYASSQGVLIPITPQESLVLYRSQARERCARQVSSIQQLRLFGWIPTV